MYFHAINVETLLYFINESWVEQSRKIHRNSASIYGQKPHRNRKHMTLVSITCTAQLVK